MLAFNKQRKITFLYLLLILFIVHSFMGCKKKTEEVYVANIFEQYFEQNILNNDFIVSYSKNQGVENTIEFEGYPGLRIDFQASEIIARKLELQVLTDVHNSEDLKGIFSQITERFIEIKTMNGLGF